jgi:hypothetical protein
MRPVFKRPGRLFAVVAGVLVIMGMATVVYLALPPRQTGDVPIPAANATPGQVVSAYLSALNSHDCRTAESATTPGAKDDAQSWCQDVGSLKDVDVKDHFMESRRMLHGASTTREPADVALSCRLSELPL